VSNFIGQEVSGCIAIAVDRVHRTPGGSYKYFYRLKCNKCKTEFVQTHEYAKKLAAPCPTCRKRAQDAKAAAGYKHPLHATWWGMLMRCLDPNSKAYKNYGGRGITICERWRGKCENGEKFGSLDGFRRFCLDMGEKPSPAHSIGRLDNDLGYRPQNCAWQTAEEQMNNTRANVWILVDGEQRTLAQWAKHLGVNAGRFASACRLVGPEKAIAAFQSVPIECRDVRWDWRVGERAKSQDQKKAELIERQKNWRKLLAEKFGW